eukprot:Seg663.7 transcript_id=Seg663.7/GoldUCD/mRNA.D3Y31 product="hypothetical protein" protein_id=Seg663.7/GoldUCD/D3Y31
MRFFLCQLSKKVRSEPGKYESINECESRTTRQIVEIVDADMNNVISLKDSSILHLEDEIANRKTDKKPAKALETGDDSIKFIKIQLFFNTKSELLRYCHHNFIFAKGYPPKNRQEDFSQESSCPHEGRYHCFEYYDDGIGSQKGHFQPFQNCRPREEAHCEKERQGD